MPHFDIERFILEVELRPAIWDSRSPEYSNKLLRSQAWEDLCKIFVENYSKKDVAARNQGAMELQRRWKSLRNCYTRELDQIRKTGSAESTGRKPYVYFQQLAFLSAVCKSRPPASADESTIMGNGEIMSGAEDTLNYQEPEETSIQIDSEPPKLFKRRKSQLEQNLLQVLARKLRKKSLAMRENDDPDRYFLLSLLPHFKDIPEYNKLEVQAEFINILKKYKQSDISSGDLTTDYDHQYYRSVSSSSQASMEPYSCPENISTPYADNSTGLTEYRSVSTSPLPNVLIPQLVMEPTISSPISDPSGTSLKSTKVRVTRSKRTIPVDARSTHITRSQSPSKSSTMHVTPSPTFKSESSICDEFFQ